MKKYMKKSLALLLALMMTLSTMSVMAMAADTEYSNDSDDSISVTDYKKNGDKSDAEAFNRAMEVAKDTSGTLTVNIPKGTYYLSDTVWIYSCTKIVAEEGATIIRKDYAKNLLGVAPYDQEEGKNYGGYTRAKNITISGGTWDGGDVYPGDTGNLFYFYHCENIRIENAILKNCWGSHHIDFTGVKDGYVTDCKFYDYHERDGKTRDEYMTAEAVHTDSAWEYTATDAVPYDGTPCTNITVEGCYFNNCCSGVGYHAPQSYDNPATDIQVIGNEFTDLWGVCVNLPFDKTVTIEGNKAENVCLFCYANGSSDITIINNEISCGNTEVENMNEFGAIQLDNQSEAYIANNTISDAVFDAIRIYESTANVVGNTINNPSGNGIYSEYSKTDTANNTINNAKGYGIYSLTDTSMTATENTIKGSGKNGIRCSGSNINLYCNTISNSGKDNENEENYDIKVTHNDSRNKDSSGTVTAYSQDKIAIWSDGVELIILDSKTGLGTNFTGFYQDGSDWYYYKNGKKTSENNVLEGTVNGQNGWWYVVNGKVQLGYTGVTDYGNSAGYWYVSKGKVDFSKTSVEQNSHGWWRVVNGKVDFSCNSVEQNNYGWWYVVGGKVDFSYTGVSNYSNAYGYWYIKDGKVDFSKTSVEKNNYGWWRVVNGKVDFSCNSVEQNQYGWWYITGGKVQFGYTGVANYANAYGWWYIKDGKVDFSKTSVEKNNYGWWRVVNGKVDFNCNSVEQNNYGWWYIVGGKVDFSYTGVSNYSNAYGYWYIKDGKVDFSCNSVEQNQYGWWYITGGKVQFGYTGVANYANANGWWYIKDGKVDFTFNGTAKNAYGTWNVVGGKVVF